MPKLVILNEKGVGEGQELQDGLTTIGRHPDSTLVLDEPTVSTYHAELLCQEGTYLLKDLQSANGVMINGVTINEGVLKHGDQITFGSVQAMFLAHAEASNDGKGVMHVPVPPANSRRDAKSKSMLPFLVFGAVLAIGIALATVYTFPKRSIHAANDSMVSANLLAHDETVQTTPRQMPGDAQPATPAVESFKPRSLRRTDVAYDFVAQVGRATDGTYQFRLALEPSSTTGEAISNGLLARGWNGKEWTFAVSSAEIKNVQQVLSQIHLRPWAHTPDAEMGMFSTTVGKVCFVNNSAFVYGNGTKLYDGFGDLTDMFGQLLEGINP